MFTNVFPPFLIFGSWENDGIEFYLVNELLKILTELFCGSQEEIGLSFLYLKGFF